MKNFKRKTILAVTLSLALVFGMAVDFSYAAKPDRTAPTAPANLKAISVSENSVTLSWNASTDNVGVTGYQIYKNNTYLNTTSTTTYSVTGLAPATTFQFMVKAKDAKGNLSAASNILTVTTTAPAPTVQPSKKIVGYYAAWAAYSGFTPDRIDPTKLTHINMPLPISVPT